MNRFFKGLLFFVIAGLIAATSLQAAVTDRYWNNPGTTGDFLNGANWNIDNPSTGTGPLVAGDFARVNNGGTANITASITGATATDPFLAYIYAARVREPREPSIKLLATWSSAVASEALAEMAVPVITSWTAAPLPC